MLLPPLPLTTAETPETPEARVEALERVADAVIGVGVDAYHG